MRDRQLLSRKDRHLNWRSWFSGKRWRLGSAAPLGPRAEHAAARYLRKHHHRVLGRNVRCRLGEIDIVATDKRTDAVVIVEVKAAARDTPPPEQHVNYAKQRKLTALAGEMVRRFKLHDRTVRFDVIAVVWPHGAKKPTRLTHYENAFPAV